VTATSIGHDFDLRAPFKGKNSSRRKLHASKEKGCQEKETLTVRETTLRTNQEIQGLFQTPARARNADRE
jgi:hypothetical protein